MVCNGMVMCDVALCYIGLCVVGFCGGLGYVAYCIMLCVGVV